MADRAIVAVYRLKAFMEAGVTTLSLIRASER